MEIIAQTDKGYIVEIEKYELQQLTGYYYDKINFKLGMEFKIHKLFKQLEMLRDQEAEIKKMVHSLKTAAGMLEKIDPIFSPEESNGTQ